MQFGNVTLHWHSETNLVVYRQGKHSGYRNTRERYLKPPKDGQGRRSNYGNSTYTTFDANWWKSQERVDWLDEKAQEWVEELRSDFGRVRVAREGDDYPSALGNPIPTEYEEPERPPHAQSENEPTEAQRRGRWWANYLATHTCRKSYCPVCRHDSTDLFDFFDTGRPNVHQASEWRKYAKQYEAESDLCIYTLELRELPNMTRWWYVGLTNKLSRRITSHRKKSRFGKKFILWDVDDVEPFDGSREDAERREHERALEVAIEKGTTNVLGGQ